MQRSTVETRLAELQREFSSGQRALAEHESRAAALRQQLLRMSGAMRVLAELLGQETAEETAKLE